MVREKNNVKFCWEIATAMGLLMPGVCFSVIVKFPLAVVKKRKCNRDKIRGW